MRRGPGGIPDFPVDAAGWPRYLGNVAVQTAAETVAQAFDVYGTFLPGPTRLTPTGIHAVDSVLGGLGPGTLAVVGALTSVGKSSLCLTAAWRAAAAGCRHGIVSLEDPPDVVGARVAAIESGVNSRKLRTKETSPGDLTRLRDAAGEMGPDHGPLFSFELGRPVHRVRAAIAELVAAGAQLVWVDYVQCLGEEPQVLASALADLHGAAADAGVPLVVLSQVTPRQSPDGEFPARPRLSWLRGTGALAIKARVVVLLWRESDGSVTGELAKSTFGEAGRTFRMLRDASGTLREEIPGAPAPVEDW